MTNSASGLACENIRFSSLFVAEDVSLGRTSFLRAKRPQRRRARRNGCFRRLPSGQDGPQICPARKSCLYFGHIINPLLTKLVRSRWFGYWLVHLCVFIYIRNVDFVWTRFETVAYGRHSLRFLWTTIELFSFHVLCFVFPVEVTLLSHNTVAVRAALATG